MMDLITGYPNALPILLADVVAEVHISFAALADDGLRSAQSTAPALYAVTNVDGRIYLTAK